MRSPCHDRPIWPLQPTCVEIYAPSTINGNPDLVEFILNAALNPCSSENQLEKENQPNLFNARNVIEDIGGHNCEEGEPNLEVFLVFLEVEYFSSQTDGSNPPIVLREVDVLRGRSETQGR